MKKFIGMCILCKENCEALICDGHLSNFINEEYKPGSIIGHIFEYNREVYSKNLGALSYDEYMFFKDDFICKNCFKNKYIDNELKQIFNSHRILTQGFIK